MDIKYEISYFDLNRDQRDYIYYHGTENTSINQIKYYIKKKLGFSYYKKYVRDVIISKL